MSRGHRDRCSEFSAPAVHIIKKRAELLVYELPEPDQRFAVTPMFEGIPAVDVEPNRLQSLKTYGIIKEVDRRNPEQRDGGGRCPIYRLTWEAASQAQHALSEAWCPLSCGHRGLENPRGVDGYVCGWSRCDVVTAPEEVRR